MKTNTNHAKKVLVALFVMLMPLLASAYFDVDSIRYNITSEEEFTVELYKCKQNIGEVVIPSTVFFEDAEYRVTSIREYAFRDCSSLTFITIPESVTII